jgi:hypothetical protein
VDAHAKFVGEATNDAASAIAPGGDLDGDGLHDIFIGAWGNNHYDGVTYAGTEAGAAYVLYSPNSGTIDLSTADVKFVGEDTKDRAGYSISGGLDINADGYGDMIIGAQREDAGGVYAGAAYIVLGPPHLHPDLRSDDTLDLSNADGMLMGEEAADYAGISVAGVGDVDGDGFDDVLVGAENHDTASSSANEGAAYLVRGPISGNIDLSMADSKFYGEADLNYAGGFVSGAGDVDADGYPDLLVGARDSAAGGALSMGTIYLILVGDL